MISLLLSHESWSKSCEHRIWGLVAFIITLMGCREAIFVDKSTFDFPIFLLFFNAKFPIFPIFSILSFLFSYFFEQPCRWTPWQRFVISRFHRVNVNHLFLHLLNSCSSIETNFNVSTNIFRTLFSYFLLWFWFLPFHAQLWWPVLNVLCFNRTVHKWWWKKCLKEKAFTAFSAYWTLWQ